MLPRIRFSMPRAQLAESAGSEGGSGALSTASVGQCGVTACRISNISFSYQLSGLCFFFLKSPPALCGIVQKYHNSSCCIIHNACVILGSTF